MTNVLVYVSGHGFGHATRTIAVLQKLRTIRPDVRFHIRAVAPAHLFARLGEAAVVTPVAVDVGVVQRNVLHPDLDETLVALGALRARAEELVRTEVALGKELGAAICLVDIPPLGCRIGKALGIPTIALGNFSWDWIYDDYRRTHPEYSKYIDEIRKDYAGADLLLRYPFHAPMDAFRRIENVPLVVMKATRPREQVRREMGLDPPDSKRLVLVSLGGGSLDYFKAPKIPANSGYHLVSFLPWTESPPDHVRFLPVESPIPHPDLVNAADVVLGKPGFSTVAECVAHGTGFIYAERDHFREWKVLADGLQQYIPSRHMPQEDLIAGRWRQHLDTFFRKNPERTTAKPPAHLGANVAAERIASFLPVNLDFEVD